MCAETDTRYQNLALGRRLDQYTLYGDGQVAATFPDPYTTGPLAHFWMCQHPAPRQVLLLGGGMGGLLREILRHPVEHVDYVEPDTRQIRLIEPFLDEPDRRALADARVTVHTVDGRHFVKTQRGRFDLVIARLPEPTSALRARFWTAEFFGELRRAMRPNAVFCTMAAAAPGKLTLPSARYLACIRATLQTHFPYVVVGWGDPAQVLAATSEGLITTDAEDLTRRYQSRHVQSPWFDPLWFAGATDWFDPDKVHQRSAELDGIEAQVSTDLRPIVYMLRLALWERMVGGRASNVVDRLLGIRWQPVAAGLGLVGGLTLGAWRVRRRSPRGWSDGAVWLSVATTGFATMALSLVWLFAFQSLYGYVYQRIGWIIALFMAGLVAGCGAMSRQAGRRKDPEQLAAYLWSRLIGVDVLLAVLAGLVPVVLPALGAMQTTPASLAVVEWLVSGLVLVTGLLGGAAFALAGGLQSAGTRRPDAAAGVVVGADHAGACLGALATGLVLVPVLGTAAAAMLLAGLKAASALVLVAGRRVQLRRA